jgi:hypothetical protein
MGGGSQQEMNQRPSTYCDMKQPDDDPSGSKYTAYLKPVNVVFVTKTVAVSFNSLMSYKNTRNKT